MFPHDHSIQNINFVGPIVRVIMENRTFTGTSGNGAVPGTRVVADVYFDDCGCTGSFPSGPQVAGYFRSYIPSQPPAQVAMTAISPDIAWDDGEFRFANIAEVDAVNLWPIRLYDGFTAITGTAFSFISPYTQLYDVDYHLQFQTQSYSDYSQYPCRLVDFDCFIKFYIGDLMIGNGSGTFTWNTCNIFTGTNVNVTYGITGTISNLYLQAGEGIVFRAEWSFTNRSDYPLSEIDAPLADPPRPLQVGVFLYGGYPNSIIYNGFRTSFRPHSTYFT